MEMLQRQQMQQMQQMQQQQQQHQETPVSLALVCLAPFIIVSFYSSREPVYYDSHFPFVPLPLFNLPSDLLVVLALHAVRMLWLALCLCRVKWA